MFFLFNTERNKRKPEPPHPHTTTTTTTDSFQWIGEFSFLSRAAASNRHKEHVKHPCAPPPTPPLSVAACPCHAADRLRALHCVPAPSYGESALGLHTQCFPLRGAGAYTSHHKSDAHWEACNTTPAEPDKPSILPFYSAAIIPVCIIISAKKKKIIKKWEKSVREKSRQRMKIQFRMLIFTRVSLPAFFRSHRLNRQTATPTS